MNIRQIRNATLRIEYAGKIFLIDPWLAKKGAMGSFADFPDSKMSDPTNLHVKMPMCELPFPAEEVISGVNAYLLTHLHPDHFDMDPVTMTGGHSLDKNIPIWVQNDTEVNFMEHSGFKHIGIFSETGTHVDDITIIKVPAIHGTEKPCGPACGLILKHPSEKTLYIAGDTIWCDDVKQTIKQYKPDVIVANACAASLLDFGRLIMDDQDLASLYDTCPDATLIASHMDTVAHATLTRKTLREKLASKGVLENFLIPEDGESLHF